MLFKSPAPLYSPEDYSKLQLHSFQTIHVSVPEKLKSPREEMTQRQHLHATPITLNVGDSVMKRSPERCCKLAPKFRGPFLVTAKLHGNKFKILESSTSISRVVLADRLKKVSALSPVADTSLSLLTYLPVLLPVLFHQLPHCFSLSVLFLHPILYIARSCGLPVRCDSCNPPSSLPFCFLLLR